MAAPDPAGQEPGEGSAPPAPPAHAAGAVRGGFRRTARQWFKIAFGLAATGAGLWYLLATWPQTGPALARIGPGGALAALLPGGAALVASMLGWRRLLADLGAPLPARPAGRIFFTGQLGKYIPGSVWTFVAQIELGRDMKVPRAVSFAASLLKVVMSLATGLLVAAALLPFGAGEALRRFWWLWLAVPILLVAAHPRVTIRLLNHALRLLRRQQVVIYPTARGMLAVFGWLTASWLMLGLHCALLVWAAGGRTAAAIPLAVGGFALAFCAGILFLPAPAGVGVREVALGLALATVLPAAAAGAVVLVSRLGLAVLDLGFAGLWSLLNRTTGPPEPPEPQRMDRIAGRPPAG